MASVGFWSIAQETPERVAGLMVAYSWNIRARYRQAVQAIFERSIY